MVYKLDSQEIKEIIDKARFTRHAKQRLNQRYHLLDDDLKGLIIKQDFAYMNTDGCINIAVTDHTYLVVAPSSIDYFVITYKEPSHNGYTVKDKYELALKGVVR